MIGFFRAMTDRRRWLRARNEGEEDKVAFPELFFDLVFVFSIIQLSHTLAGHYSLIGWIETIVMILAVWWVWIFTTWVTNWLDPDRMAVRAMLFALMFGGLLLSSAIPHAFGDKAALFALSYVCMQVGRSLFAVYAFAGHSRNNCLNFIRITGWLCFSGIFWIAGLFAEDEMRLTLWIVAIGIEYVSPALGFRLPGLGKSTVEDWDVLGSHMAERCALFVIICLGETILIGGAKFAEMELTPLTFLMFFASFTTTVTMWWIYFRFGQERAAAHIEHADTPGELARTVFTYAHIPIVAGIILDAVAVEFMLAHPHGHTDFKTASAMIGGPLLFILGNIWIKGAVAPRLPLSHLVGLGLLVALIPASLLVEPYILFFACAGVLVVVALWEYLSLKPAD